MSDRPRGSFLLFWVAFGFVLAAGAVLAFSARSFFETLTPLHVSAGLSAIAIVVAIVGLVVPRR